MAEFGRESEFADVGVQFSARRRQRLPPVELLTLNATSFDVAMADLRVRSIRQFSGVLQPFKRQAPATAETRTVAG
ncbi:hypothetical protein [Caballeronia sp. BCC1704]|uniref:hypothetical protein n=1 Tax=Caballeronia sp. BCC1704 TaxID=2676300 RepID=UPI00158B5F48|nr:hypothetical protein [Caballeronia sp. BCC1704]